MTNSVDMRPVVVIGGGPIGLTTALGLVHYGLPVIVLEEDAELSRDTKAGTLLARTLEIFERYGVGAEVLAQCLRIDEIGDIDRRSGKTLRSIKTWLLDDETRYPFAVNIPQHYLEPVLAEALESRAPGALRMSQKVTRFESHDDGVNVWVETPSGEDLIKASYLLACDGGRSATRRAIGAELVGTTFPERYMLIDLKVDLDVANARDYPYLAYFSDPDEWMILVRHPEFWRFLFPRKEEEPALSSEELAAKAREYIGDVDGVEIVGSYEYSVHARAAAHWRQGRVFLLGDSAHLITPMWALGLNTGVLDASNLPWRLAWVERGWASPTLLDGYEKEQLPIAMHGSGAMAQAARDYMSHVSQSLDAMTDHDQANAMTRSLLGVRVDPSGQGNWRMAVGSEGLDQVQVGDRLPDMIVRKGDGTHTFTHDLVRDVAISLLFADVRRRPQLPDDVDGLRNFVVSRWDAPLDSGLRSRALLDIGSKLQQRLGVEDGTVILVRPDEFVAAIGQYPEDDGLALYQALTHPHLAREGVLN